MALFIKKRNGFALRAPNAHGKNLHADAGSLFRRTQRIAVMIFAIRQKNEDAMIALARFKTLNSHAYGVANSRPWNGNTADIQRIQNLLRGVRINRQGTL